MLLWIGGTSIDIDAIVYEDSPRGEFGKIHSLPDPEGKRTSFARFFLQHKFCLIFCADIFRCTKFSDVICSG
jgi:hypothetical protein